MFADFHGVSTPTLTSFRLLTWLTKHRVGKTCLELALMSWFELAQAHHSIRPVTVHAHAHTHTHTGLHTHKCLPLPASDTEHAHPCRQRHSTPVHTYVHTEYIHRHRGLRRCLSVSCCVPDSGLGLVVNITRSLTWGRWPSTRVDGPSKNHSND